MAKLSGWLGGLCPSQDGTLAMLEHERAAEQRVQVAVARPLVCEALGA